MDVDPPAAGTAFHVAPQGSDQAPGTRTAPFATLARARDAIRQLKAPGPLTGPVQVWLHGGKHYLEQPLRLTEQDSGTQDCPVTWAAWPGEMPVLSGGRRVTGWEPFRGPILRAELPGSRGGRWPYRQLFWNGRRQTRARWPKADPTEPLYGGWAYTEGPGHEGSTDSFVYRPGTFPRSWAKPTEVEVVYWASIGGWNSRVPIRSLDPSRRLITLAHSGWQFDVPGWYMPVTFSADNRFYVENALEELTAPGEWCFDSEDGDLYFWPPDGSAEPEVVVPVLETLIELRGAAWIHLAGLIFTETGDGDNFHREGVEGTGAMYPRPGWRYCGEAVHLKEAVHCRISGCCFDAVGGNGIYLEGACCRNEVVENEFSEAGANSVCLLGTRLKHPFANRITDNHIHHGGAICKYTAGVFCGMSDGNRISHNLIEYLPHHGVNLSNSPHGRNLVEYNLIRWVDQEVADSTAINCWMEDPPQPEIERCGHVIRGNVIADVYGCEVSDGKAGPSQRFPTSGIYLDNYTSNCLVTGNLIQRCTHAGILVHAGRNNLIEENLVVDCLAGIRFQDYVSGMEYWRPMQGFMTGNQVRRNLCWHSGEQGYGFSLHAWTERVLAESDQNLFYRQGAEPFAVEQADTGQVLSRTDWQRLGHDRHSLFVDPRFADPEHDDFRLRPDSPALALGLTVPDPKRAGIRRPTD